MYIELSSMLYNACICIRYQIDEISPDDGMYEEQCYYWILSKTIKQKSSATGPQSSVQAASKVTNGMANDAEKVN